MNFGDALICLKHGNAVQREGWNGKGLYLRLQKPDENSKMTLPYIYMCYPSTPASPTMPEDHLNAKVPWLASQTDMLSEDWQIAEGGEEEVEEVVREEVPAEALPRYKCKKVVEAFKITAIHNDSIIGLFGNKYQTVVESPNYFEKHQPYAGGYYVRYEDGYTSFSPAEAFEKGYDLIES